jgi:hypothetical protein
MGAFQHNSGRKFVFRCTDGVSCVLAGGLAVLGAVLALLVHPWFAGLAAAAGIWLIFAPESKGASTGDGSSHSP